MQLAASKARGRHSKNGFRRWCHTDLEPALDAAFDNSDRRKHGMGYLGRMMTGRRRAKRRAPESTRKRKLGGNSVDHRPFFTYWMTTVQIFIMLITIAVYKIGPIGIDLYKKLGMVSFLTLFFFTALQILIG